MKCGKCYHWRSSRNFMRVVYLISGRTHMPCVCWALPGRYFFCMTRYLPTPPQDFMWLHFNFRTHALNRNKNELRMCSSHMLFCLQWSGAWWTCALRVIFIIYSFIIEKVSGWSSQHRCHDWTWRVNASIRSDEVVNPYTMPEQPLNTRPSVIKVEVPSLIWLRQ